MTVSDDAIDAQVEAMAESFRSVRDLLLSNAGSPATAQKNDSSPVTEIDIMAEQQTKKHFSDHFADVPVLGEEGGYDPDNLPKICWLIDPIDGTKSYIKNVAGYTTMGVLIQNNQAIASVVYEPITDLLYTAIRGKGLYKNGKLIKLQDQPMPSTIFCKKAIVDKVRQIFLDQNLNVESAPSGAGFGFVQILEGKSAARIHIHAGPNIHDHAPGALLIQESGGLVLPVFNEDFNLKTKSFIACHPDFKAIAKSHIQAIRAIEDPQQAPSER